MELDGLAQTHMHINGLYVDNRGRSTMGDSQINLYHGDSLIIYCTVHDSDGDIVNLSAYDEIYFTVKTTLNSETALIDEKLSDSPSIITKDNTKGKITITLEESLTSLEAGLFYYEITIEDSDGVLEYVVVQDFFKIMNKLAIPGGG
jgi:hypothetical protein